MKTRKLSNPRFNPSLGVFLKSVRKEKGMTKQAVAKRAKVDVIFYDAMEREKRFISFSIALRLAKVLDLPMLSFEKYLEK